MTACGNGKKARALVPNERKKAALQPVLDSYLSEKPLRC